MLRLFFKGMVAMLGALCSLMLLMTIAMLWYGWWTPWRSFASWGHATTSTASGAHDVTADPIPDYGVSPLDRLAIREPTPGGSIRPPCHHHGAMNPIRPRASWPVAGSF